MEQNVKSQLEFINSHGRGLWLINGVFYRVVTLANEEIDAGKEHDYPPIVTYESRLDGKGRRYAITVEKFLKKAVKMNFAEQCDDLLRKTDAVLNCCLSGQPKETIADKVC